MRVLLFAWKCNHKRSNRGAIGIALSPMSKSERQLLPQRFLEQINQDDSTSGEKRHVQDLSAVFKHSRQQLQYREAALCA